MNAIKITKRSPLPKNTLVVFDYPDEDGNLERRSLLVDVATSKHLAGNDLFRGGEYRKFLRGKIANKSLSLWGTLINLTGE